MKSKLWALAFLASTVAIAFGLGWTLRPSRAELPEREDAVLPVPEPRRTSLVELETPLREPVPAASSRTAAIASDAPASKPRDEDAIRADLERMLAELRAPGRDDLMADSDIRRVLADLRDVQEMLRRGELEFPQLSVAEAREILDRSESVAGRSK